MKIDVTVFALLATTIGLSLPVSGDDTEADTNIAKTYARIVADYQQIESVGTAEARIAAGRLVGDAYRLLIDQAQGVPGKSADDLYALGACHEGLGDMNVARQRYLASLAIDATAEARLALVRVTIQDDLGEAEKHFSAARDIDPQFPGLSQFHLLLANAHLNKLQWNEAASHLQQYLDLLRALAEERPEDGSRQALIDALDRRLQIVRSYDEMTGKPAMELDVQHWVQGELTGIAALKGKVVAIDFCAMWAARLHRMERMKKLYAKYSSKGLEVIGATLAYGHNYDAETDRVDMQAHLAPEDEKTSLVAFAKKQGIPYHLAMIDRSTAKKYGVSSLPHVVLLDAGGSIRVILPGGGERADALLEAKIMDLLGLP